MKHLFRNIGLFLSWLYVAIVPLVVGIIFNSKLSVVALLSGIGMVLIAALPQIRSFKAGPIMAEMREVIFKAEVTMEQLRALAKALSKSSLSSIVRSGWLEGLPEELLNGLHDEVKKNLSDLGIPSKDMDDIEADYHNCVLLKYWYLVLGINVPYVKGARVRTY